MGKNLKTLEEIKTYVPRFFTDLEPVEGKGLYTCKITVYNYTDMMQVATNIIKLCVVATDPDSGEVSDLVQSNSIDISRMLELALQLLPINIDELADEIRGMVEEEL